MEPPIGPLRRRGVRSTSAAFDATERARWLASRPILGPRRRRLGIAWSRGPALQAIVATERARALWARPVVGPHPPHGAAIRRSGARLDELWRARALRARPVVGPHPPHAGVGCRSGARLDELWRARGLRDRPAQLAPHLVPKRADLLRRGRTSEFVAPAVASPIGIVRSRSAGHLRSETAGKIRAITAGHLRADAG